MTTLDDMSREAGWYDRRKNAMQAQIDKLEDQRDYLRDALTEAIEELDSLIRPEHMSATKAQQHTDWMAWLRSALPKEAGDDM